MINSRSNSMNNFFDHQLNLTPLWKFKLTNLDIFNNGRRTLNSQTKVYTNGKEILLCEKNGKVIKTLILSENKTKNLALVPEKYTLSTNSLDSYIRGCFDVSVPKNELYPFVHQSMRITLPPWSTLPNGVLKLNISLVYSFFGFKTYVITFDEIEFLKVAGDYSNYLFFSYLKDNVHPDDKGFIHYVSNVAKTGVYND